MAGLPPDGRGGYTVRVWLRTVGRRSGRPHTVRITAVAYQNAYYFSRHRPDSDWFLNAVSGQSAEIVFDGGKTVRGPARRVDDDSLMGVISGIKYPGQARAKERRVGIVVLPEAGDI